MKHRNTLLAAGLLVTTYSFTAQASLFDRGNGLIYDDVLDVTWLQNANLAASETFGVSGIQANGSMDWATAQNWISAMNASNYQGFNNWRLPDVTPINGQYFDYGSRPDGDSIYIGNSDWGYNISSPNSELAYMYYANLGNQSRYVPTYDEQTGLIDIFTPTQNPNWTGDLNSTSQGWTIIYGEPTYVDPVTFSNLQSYAYWSGVEYALPESAWAFYNYEGGQFAYLKNSQFYAWAVRDGDVSAVPLPAAAWLFLSGMIGVLGLKRKRAA